MASRQKHPGFTNAEFKRLGEYFRWAADQMGLRDWYIDLMYRPPEEKDGTPDTNAAARVEIPWGKRYVQVFICAEFMEYRPERQRQFVVHELLHCHFDHLDSLTQNELRDHVGEIYWQAWHPGFWLMFENTIDAIANAWAEKLPVISWPKPPPKAAPRRKGKRG